MAEVEYTGEETTTQSMKDYFEARRSRIVFFVLNLALVIPYIIQNYSHWGLGGAVAILILSFYLLVIKPYDTLSAARGIPVQLFLNMCLYLVVSHQTLIEHFNMEQLGNFFGHLEGECAVLLVVGLAVSFFIPKSIDWLWLRYAGKTAVGAAIILQIWGGGRVFEPKFSSGGEAMLMFYLLGAIFWFVFCIMSSNVDTSTYKRNNRLSNLLLILLLLFCTTESLVARRFTMEVQGFLLTMPTGALAWWKVILSAVVLVGCALATFDYRNEEMGPDAMMLCLVASAMIVIRVLMANYFTFNWIIFAVFMVSSVKCFKNELRLQTTLRLSSLVYVIVQLAVTLVAIWLLKAGLWINLIVVAVYTLIFYATAKKGNGQLHKLRLWLTILSVPAVYAIAYIWHMRFGTDAIVLVVLAYAVLAGTMIILHWPHPDNRTVPDGYKVALCAMLVVLCLAAMGRFGAKVNVEFETEKDIATVEIEAKGKHNEIETVEYQWSTLTGEKIEGAVMDKAGASIPVLGEVLTITVTDTHGVVTTKTEWYPDWLLPE